MSDTTENPRVILRKYADILIANVQAETEDERYEIADDLIEITSKVEAHGEEVTATNYCKLRLNNLIKAPSSRLALSRRSKFSTSRFRPHSQIVTTGNCSDWSRYGLGEDQGLVGVAASQTPGAEQGSEDTLGFASLLRTGPAADLPSALLSAEILSHS